MFVRDNLNARSCDVPVALALALFCLAGTVNAQFCPDAGSVLSTTDTAEGDAPFMVRCCDLDRDGALDLVTANDGSDTVSVLRNNGDGTFAPKTQWPVDTDEKTIAEPVDVVCCDLNGDDLIDLATANHTSDDVSVLINLGALTFAAPVAYPVGEAPFGIECIDLDGQSGNDLITNGFTEDAVSVLLNNGLGVFAPHVPYAVGDAPIALTLCDVDGDSVRDVVTANMLSKDVTALKNNADGTFTTIGTAAICTTPMDCINPFDIACCDFDGVSGPDVATSNGIDDSVAVLFNDGSGGFGNLAVHGGVDGAYGIACCDLDAGGGADLITANLASDDLGIFFNDGSGGFGTPSLLSVGVDSATDPSSVVCCNVDNDADEDLVSTFVDGLNLFENDCSGAECGNGIVESGEDCDDAGESATCDADCTFAECGDGTINTTAGEECDDGVDNSDTTPNACRKDCALPFCGDGVVDFGEECDDGNQNNGDGCSSQCVIETSGDCPTPDAVASGGRYMAVTPAPGSDPVAIRVEGDGSDPAIACVSLYVQTPEKRCVGGVNHQELCASDLDCDTGTCQASAVLGTDFVRLTPDEWGTVHVRGAEIRPSSLYRVRADCGDTPGVTLSTAVTDVTWLWGDTDHDAKCNGGPNADQPCERQADCPDALCRGVDVIDITRGVDAFRGRYGPTLTLEANDLMGCIPNRHISVIDITAAIDAFRGLPFRCDLPCPP